MNNKEINIVPPEGYEIDKENSTFECIKFKPIPTIKPNILTSLRDLGLHETEGSINGKRAFVIFKTEAEGNGYCGAEVSGHRASLFLSEGNYHGEWYDQAGKKINGYLFYKPLTNC
jgi:hypothetical protein